MVFIPLFMLCKIENGTLPTLFTSDAWPYIFTALFAVSNGYIANLSMMLGAGLAETFESALAGTIMVFALTSGLFAGACLSFLLVYIATGSV